MTNAASPAASVEAPRDLKGRALLLISSPSPTKRFIFQRLKSLGLRLVLLSSESSWASRYCDDFIAADSHDSKEALSRVEDYLKDGRLDGALTFWENAVPLCAALCEKFGWAGHPPQAALNARNKIFARKALDVAGLARYSPRWSQIRNAKELEREAKRLGFPFVLKPAWGEQSQFVVRVDGPEDARHALDYLKANITPVFDPIYAHGTEIIAEAYLDGAEVDADLLLQDGEVRFHAFTDNFPTKEPFFVEAGDAMPSRHEEGDLAAVLAMARQSVAALGLKNGALHVEAKIGAEGPRLIEVNARMGGDYLHDWVKTVWGVDLVEESARIALRLPCAPAKLAEPRAHLVSRYLVPPHSGVISGLSAPPEKPDPAKVHDVTLLKEPGDAVLVPPEGFEAVGWVVGRGDTYAQAEENLDEALGGVAMSIARFDSTSSIGKTRRRNRFNAAQVARRRILQSARMEKIRGLDPRTAKELHVGILCNIFDESAEAAPGAEAAVHQDLTSVGLNIRKAVESKGHRVTFFDMNETPLPFNKIAEANVDLVFNVCERINNSSLLEPHAAAVLDCLGIPYTGSNPLTLALCIDKVRVKKLLEYHGLPTPKFDYVFQQDEKIREDLRYPLMVKLANTDNSIGISNQSVVTSLSDLKAQVRRLLDQYNRPVLIEEYIDGDEIDVSILGNEDRVKVLPLSRSIFDELPQGTWHIYPFQAKWSQDSVYEKIKVERPAKYSQKLTALISEICLDAYNLFDCHDYARVEVRLDKAGNPYILEVNPNPSINRGDCVPNCAEMIGLAYEDFIDEILREAILRYRARPPYYHLQSALAPL